MNLAELTLELKQVLRDPTAEASFPTWLNQAVSELSGQYDLPVLRLRVPAILSTSASAWLYDLSDALHPSGYAYQKKVFRIASSTQTNGYILEHNLQALDDADATGYSGTHTDTGTEVLRVAIEGNQLGIYPMVASQDLALWFYRQPVAMSADTDEPDGIDGEWQYRVLIPFVVLRAFRVYPELTTESITDGTRALRLWEGRLQAGLYGDGFQQGWVHSLAKQRGVRTRGPALGSSMSGGYARRMW